MSDRRIDELPVKSAAQLALTDFLIGHGDGAPAAFRSELDEVLDFLGPTLVSRFSDDIVGEVVERGGTDVSFYVRFADGTQICVIRQGAIGEVTNSFGAGYIRSVSAVTWPAAFVDAPKHFAFAHKSSGNAPIWAAGGTNAATPTSAPQVWVNVWVSTSDTNNIVERLGIGRWK